MPHMVMEVLPQTIILPKCAVSAARNIAQNPVEFENVLLIVNFEVWQESSVILGNKQGRRVESPSLMSEHIRSLDICVVGYHVTGIHHAVLMQVLQDLYRLAAWSCTHVKACVLRFDIQSCYRDHAHLLLPENPAVLSLQDQKLVKVFEGSILPHCCSTKVIEAISHLIWVPLDRFGCL